MSVSIGLILDVLAADQRIFIECSHSNSVYLHDGVKLVVDKLELLVDDEDWPWVKYRELLFLR